MVSIFDDLLRPRLLLLLQVDEVLNDQAGPDQAADWVVLCDTDGIH